MKATPPMTPPAMAPTFVLLAGAGLEAMGSIWQATEAHVSHVRELCTQTWLAGHVMPSQDRGACSHNLQRLSRRKTLSASGMVLVY